MKKLLIFLTLLVCMETAPAQVSVKHTRTNTAKLGKSLFMRQPDGKLIYFTATGGNFYSGRLFANGDNDDEYAGARTSKTKLADLVNCKTQTAVIDKWNRIIIAGSSCVDSGSGRVATMVRLTRNGDPDADFVRGVVQVKVGDSSEFNGVYLAPDEKIMTIGSCYSDGAFHFFCARLQYNGDNDEGFGVHGAIVDNSMPDNNKVIGIVQQPDGKVVVAGCNYSGDASNVVVARYLADGTKDVAFGVGGSMVLKAGYLHPQKIALQPDGKILVAGTSAGENGGQDLFLVRFTQWGTVDSTFAKTGMVRADVSFEDRVDDMTVLPDGRIVLSGACSTKGERRFSRYLLLRFSADGDRDDQYGYGNPKGLGPYVVKKGYTTISHNISVSESEWKIYRLSEMISDDETETILALTTFLLDTSLGTIDVPNRKVQSNIYPVPVKKSITFSFDLIDEQKVTVKLLESNDKEVATIINNELFKDGENAVTINLPPAAKPGNYWVVITTAEGYKQIIEVAKL